MPDQNFYDGDLSYIRLQEITSDKLDIGSILNKVKGAGGLLSDYCNIAQGIVTGADKLSEGHISRYGISGAVGDGIFVLSKKEVQSLRLSDSEKLFLKPWFKNSDIQKWVTNKNNNEYLIYYTSKTLMKIGDTLISHFKKYKPLLINRNIRSGTPIITPEVYDRFVKGNYQISYVMVASAFKRGAYYCISYARDTGIEYFECPKIVAPQRSKTNTFGYNEIPWYAASDVFLINEKDKTVSLKYVLALLNSSLYYLWLYYRGKRKGENLELIAKTLSEIPIKKINKDEQESFVEIVNKILITTDEDDYSIDSLKKAKVKEYEKQIDKMVYKLYELTPEEIEIVENSAN